MANMVCTVTHQDYRSVKVLRFDWLSDDAAGTAAGASTKVVNGQILRIDWISDGVDTPDNLWDSTLLDADGVDVMLGLGADIAVAATQTEVPIVTDGNNGNMAPIAVDSILTLAVAAAGNAKVGAVVVYYR